MSVIKLGQSSGCVAVVRLLRQRLPGYQPCFDTQISLHYFRILTPAQAYHSNSAISLRPSLATPQGRECLRTNKAPFRQWVKQLPWRAGRSPPAADALRALWTGFVGLWAVSGLSSDGTAASGSGGSGYWPRMPLISDFGHLRSSISGDLLLDPRKLRLAGVGES